MAADENADENNRARFDAVTASRIRISNRRPRRRAALALGRLRMRLETFPGEVET